MPKGALLHAHLDATVDAKVLLRFALSQPAVHVRAIDRLSATNRRVVLPEFRGLPKEEWTDFHSITDPTYVPGTWVPIQNARYHFNEVFGGPEGFDKWVLDALMIDPSEAYGTHNTIAKIWEKFSSTFAVSGVSGYAPRNSSTDLLTPNFARLIYPQDLFRFIPIFVDYVRDFLLSSIDDGISYVEPRINFWFK